MINPFFIVLNYVLFAFKGYVLYILQKDATPLLDQQDNGDVVFRPVNRWNRLFHHLFDVAFYFSAIYSTSSTYRYLLFNTNFLDIPFLASLIRASNTLTGASIIVSFFTLFYYLVLEVVFNITIGKTILGNIIVNDEGARPSIAQRFGRTFCRLIPFNALSFLFNQRGWHDSITNTYVVKAEKR
ncbi:MAG: RDD family protein [Pedobacter sp.]|uniref:RDD family protein n=1 Tax=Pedobacter sp. TaxID=1411316 RepID=UPI002808BC5F|nr:RDD family protein [Pedobacter sp.]MDQ8003872.1 RDD family protein [Pedobacter sp.]